MDYLVRKVLTQTEYAALKDTLQPYEGVVIVNDGLPNVVEQLAIGSVTFDPSGTGGAPSNATYLTNTDQTTSLPNSINIANTNLTVGSQSLLMNNPSVFGEANIVGNVLQEDQAGFLFIDNGGNMSQTTSCNFGTTSLPRQDVTFGNVDAFVVDTNDIQFTTANTISMTAGAYALNGNTVGSDTGFDGPTITTNFIQSNTTDIVFKRQLIGTPLKVTYLSNVEVDFQGNVYTNFTSSTGTTVVVGASNQLFLLTSSQRFKEDIQPVEINHEVLSNIYKLEPVTFRYKNGSEEEGKVNKKTVGLIAEEVNKLFPEVVNLDEKGEPFSIDYNGIAVLLLAAMKELKAENSRLAVELEEIKVQLGNIK